MHSAKFVSNALVMSKNYRHSTNNIHYFLHYILLYVVKNIFSLIYQLWSYAKKSKLETSKVSNGCWKAGAEST